MLQKTHFIFGFIGLLLLASCTDKKDDTTAKTDIFNQWKLANPNANVVLLVRSDSTFHVDVLAQKGIEIEGRVELNQDKISFINIQGTDSISSDPRPGVYDYQIKSDTIHFTIISDPLDRRSGFLSLPWVKTLE